MEVPVVRVDRHDAVLRAAERGHDLHLGEQHLADPGERAGADHAAGGDLPEGTPGAQAGAGHRAGDHRRGADQPERFSAAGQREREQPAAGQPADPVQRAGLGGLHHPGAQDDGRGSGDRRHHGRHGGGGAAADPVHGLGDCRARADAERGPADLGGGAVPERGGFGPDFVPVELHAALFFGQRGFGVYQPGADHRGGDRYFLRGTPAAGADFGRGAGDCRGALEQRAARSK